MTTFDGIKPRPTQTRVKHTILEEYFKAWGGIILNGLYGKRREAHFVYVDCNASYGRFDGELTDDPNNRCSTPVFGSPIIGIRVLDALSEMAQKRGIDLRTNAILIEKEAKPYRELHQSLDLAGLRSRIHETQQFDTLPNRHIAIVRADSTAPTMVARLLNYTQSTFKYSLYFLDPYGPKAIPFSAVQAIIRARRHDVIINMPYLYVDRRRNLATQEVLNGGEQQRILDLNRMFDGTTWQTCVRETGTESESLLVEYYREVLERADDQLSVKSIRLRFPDKERSMFYLYLTTHDANGAVKMNEVLWNAGLQEHELRWRFRDVQREQKTGQTSLFSLFEDVVPLPPEPQRPSTEEIAEVLFDRYKGKTLTRGAVYQGMADDMFFATEIDKALRYLRKPPKPAVPRASFEGDLRSATLIIFGK
jgi:three-Cys-motif partner protein